MGKSCEAEQMPGGGNIKLHTLSRGGPQDAELVVAFIVKTLDHARVHVEKSGLDYPSRTRAMHLLTAGTGERVIFQPSDTCEQHTKHTGDHQLGAHHSNPRATITSILEAAGPSSPLSSTVDFRTSFLALKEPQQPCHEERSPVRTRFTYWKC